MKGNLPSTSFVIFFLWQVFNIRELCSYSFLSFFSIFLDLGNFFGGEHELTQWHCWLGIYYMVVIGLELTGLHMLLLPMYWDENYKPTLPDQVVFWGSLHSSMNLFLSKHLSKQKSWFAFPTFTFSTQTGVPFPFSRSWNRLPQYFSKGFLFQFSCYHYLQDIFTAAREILLHH